MDRVPNLHYLKVLKTMKISALFNDVAMIVKTGILGAHDSDYPNNDWEDAYGNKIDWDDATIIAIR